MANEPTLEWAYLPFPYESYILFRILSASVFLIWRSFTLLKTTDDRRTSRVVSLEETSCRHSSKPQVEVRLGFRPFFFFYKKSRKKQQEQVKEAKELQEAGCPVPRDLVDAVQKRREQLKTKARKQAERRAQDKAKKVVKDDSPHNGLEVT